MLLPNVGQAIIPPEKLRDYLLNPEHPQNRGKARLYAALGYTAENWEELAEDLRAQHAPLDAEEQIHPFWKRYIIVGRLQGPRGSATIRSVWQIDSGSHVPRFITRIHYEENQV